MAAVALNWKPLPGRRTGTVKTEWKAIIRLLFPDFWKVLDRPEDLIQS